MHVDQSTGYLQRLLKRDLPLAATVGVSIVNGLDFSPVFDSVSFYLYGFARESPSTTASCSSTSHRSQSR